jgi:single-stranded-DNA-specific exonuclease
MFPLHDPLEETVRAALAAYDDLTAALLARRGIATAEDAEAFLSPSYDKGIHDPMLMTDMPKAAKRLADAIGSGEKIAVWSDYDCDGIPGGVVLHDFLKKAGANFVNYVPHRHNEGYGMNVPGLEKLAKEGVSLVVTVDSGITNVAEVIAANALGMEVIVTDHHLPAEEGLPPAFAVLNPNAREDETYPYKSLCGAGVAWKLACATLAVGFPGRDSIPEGWEKWLLDMAGMATIADMVPLTGENRVIASYGLLVMRKSPRIGLQKLCRQARVDQKKITEDDVGFMLAPRVNAASRMGDPFDAFLLLSTTDETRAEELARKLESLNRSRRAAAGAITRAVHERLAERKERGETIPAVIAMGDPDWRPGLLGLVANSIAEEYGRPVFLWGREGNDLIKGSCRSGPGGANMVALMQAAGDALLSFGGHKASGGFSVEPSKVFDLEARLSEALATLPPEEDKELLCADAHLPPESVTKELLRAILKLAPYGMGNPRPMIALHDVRVEQVSWFGKAGEHLRLAIGRGHAEFPEAPIEAMTFYAKRQMGEETCGRIEKGMTVSILAHVEEDTYTRGQPMRLRIVSVRT